MLFRVGLATCLLLTISIPQAVSALPATGFFGGKVESYGNAHCPAVTTINTAIKTVICPATGGIVCPQINYDELVVKMGDQTQKLGVLGVRPHTSAPDSLTINLYKAYLGFDFKKEGAWVVGQSTGVKMSCNPCTNSLVKGLLKKAGLDISKACRNKVSRAAINLATSGCSVGANQCPAQLMCYVGSSAWKLPNIIEFGLCPPSLSTFGIPI